MFESWGYKFRCQSLVLCILFLINISRIADSCQRTLKIWLKSNWNSANRYAIYLSLCFAVFFPENFNWYLFIYIYIIFFLFVGLISVICWFLHCRRESDQALWHFYWVWVFDSLTWGVEMGVAVQHLPQIIQWLAQVAIHFSTLTSGFRWFFFVPPNRGVEKPWKSEWRSLEVFHTPSRAVRFPPALLGICLALFFNLPLMSHKMPLHELKQKQCKKIRGRNPLHISAFTRTFSAHFLLRLVFCLHN